jgi:two-component system sensor histidine kinase/response regulator
VVVSLVAGALVWPLLRNAFTIRRPSQRRTADVEGGRESRFLAEAMPQIVWTATPDGAVDYFNEHWLEYTGLTFDQTQGWGWASVLHPDDLANCVNVWTHAVQSGTPYEIEYRLKRASDGAYRWHLGRALPFRDASGSIIKWFGICTDIDDQKRASEAAGRLTEQLRLNASLGADLTARKRAEAALVVSEQRFREVEEHAPIGLALVALDGPFIRVNPALCALTGYHRAELLSMTFGMLTHPDDRDADLAFVKRALSGEIATYEMEKRYVHKDGGIVWVLLNACLVRDDTGSPSYFLTQIQDISARKAVQEELRSAQLAALAATDAKSRFLATMSHEIRTPMNGIIGMTELLSLSQLSDEQHGYVEIVRNCGRSLLRVLNDILDYSKIEAGKLELECVGFDVSSQVESVVSLIKPQFNAKGVSVSVQIDPDLPSILAGDPSRVRQVLMNLVGNALKFTPAGGSVRVVVGMDSGSSPTMVAVRIAVIDNGVGVAPEARDQLFVPFSQVDSSTTRKYGGTGLGLSICKQLVNLMQGQIGVDRPANGGASFWFVIPLARHAGPEHIGAAPEREAGERRASARMRSERVLLAEDNDVNSFLATRQFKQLGFDVSVVTNGLEAVLAVQREHFDIVFMDCHMPELDGWTAAKQIRGLASDLRARVPIVALTADAQAADQQACLDAGMDDYISKPATLTDLEAALARWLPNKHTSAA